MAGSVFNRFVSVFAAAASAFKAFALAVGGLVIAIVEAAFPIADPPLAFAGVAAAPRVTGLAQSRSFRQRLLEHSPSGRRRAPMSHAFAAAA